MYDAIKARDFDPYEEEDEEWLQRCLLEFHAMYRQNVIKRVAERGSEEDLIVRLWRFFDSCFDCLDIETRRGEVACVAKINNEAITSTLQSQRATKPDLILTKDSLELGSGENGRFTGSACGNKEHAEKVLKNPKTMKNMMNLMINQIRNKEQLIHELQVIGFTHFHLKAKLSVMDVPCGYVCRIRHFEELKVPEDQELFCSLFPMLSLALIGKNIVKQTLETLKKDNIATSYVAKPANQALHFSLPPTMSLMCSKQRLD
ncbi:hypothetical protein BD560DRAFT_391031 [Blakeslea trispora]|nr:hypothetical protein BD560DRAFT_391031 [Blakeslea trispora]